ncbi:hypothetical protein B7494_g454 [Chlorociboria aeruginascens]|nr:hypothetical protein B7494_g454 [Chlorociboria aeruginascens]
MSQELRQRLRNQYLSSFSSSSSSSFSAPSPSRPWTSLPTALASITTHLLIHCYGRQTRPSMDRVETGSRLPSFRLTDLTTRTSTRSSTSHPPTSRQRSNTTTATIPKDLHHVARPATSPGEFPAAESTAATPRPPKARNVVPASHSRNARGRDEESQGPPLSMKTPRSNSITKDWVSQQATKALTSPTLSTSTFPSRKQQPESPRTPVIPPIRAFKSSRRPMDQDEDPTLREASQGRDEHNSDDSDLFLRAAKEEARQANNGNRKPRVFQRQSLPPSSTTYAPLMSRRRGSDQEEVPGSHHPEEENISQALTYRSSARDRTSGVLDINNRRYQGSNSRSTPSTPRTFGHRREISPESQESYGSRGVDPLRTASYRQSNLSYSAPRTYNSSPLVARTKDVNVTPEPARPADSTESSVSATAPSTVWDELEDLKSRIRKLELTGKLPPTSGAAISRASNERPPTATTTATTLSSSPKRARGNSISPTDSSVLGHPHGETHPLLHSALAKSKSLLSPEVYNALEATASDALAITAMMGTSGQPGPLSSTQSTAGGVSSVSDRQVRRKADSMCRSLTELCLALSEGKPEQIQPVANQASALVRSIEPDIRNSTMDSTQQPQVVTDLARFKPGPRSFTRLDTRRNSTLGTGSLPSPRNAPSEAGTPTHSSMAGRRTSLLLRSRRGATEEPEEDGFRAPSRATTDIGRLRNPLREYIPPSPPIPSLVLDNKPPVTHSALPVRRHFPSTSLTNPNSSTGLSTSIANSRRVLDRSTPERDTASNIGRLTEDRGQRKFSVGPSFSLGRNESVSKRTGQPSRDSLTAGQPGGYI